MADSQIESIYDAIVAWTPIFDTDVSVGVRDIDQLKETLHADDCPVRMLSVTTADIGGEFAFIALGKTNTVTWSINDRLYLKGAGLAKGIESFSANLIKYTASYVGQIRDNRAPTSQSHVVSASFNPGVFEWSGEKFAGLDVFLTIEEVISGA